MIGFDVYDGDELVGTFDLQGAVDQLERCGPHQDSRAVVHGTGFVAGTGTEMATADDIKQQIEKRLEAMNHYNGLDETMGKAPQYRPADATTAIETTRQKQEAQWQWQQDCLRDHVCSVCLTDIDHSQPIHTIM